MFANQGVIRCYGVDPHFRPGAVPRGDPRHRGLAWVTGQGRADVVEWTTNRAVVEVSGAEPGALVAYNMNYDPSWRANGEPALDHEGVVATRLEPGTHRVEFRYFPRTFAWSLPIFALTASLCFARRRHVTLVVALFGRWGERLRRPRATG